MRKIICLPLLYIFLAHSLSAKEPTMAILTNIITNSTQKFNIGNYNFYCEPYGVISLEKLYARSAPESKCRESIVGFYNRHPDLKYFTQEVMKVMQMYHLEFKEKQCIIYARGQKTLSELLLENGLALIKPNFDDEEFRYLFYKAQLNAKISKSGMWSEQIDKDCVSELK